MSVTSLGDTWAALPVQFQFVVTAGCRTTEKESDQSCTMATDPPVVDPVSAAQREAFEEHGFVVLERLVTREFAAALCTRLDQLLLGHYDVPGGEPDKVPKLSRDTRCKPGKKPRPTVMQTPNRRTLQLINVWKADSLFRQLVLSPTLGRFVADLAGWSCGARVANDQVWAKPPGASALVFHRDSAYFDFAPPHVVTVWIALDDMTKEVGLGVTRLNARHPERGGSPR